MLLGVASGWESRKGLDDIVKIASMTEARIIIVGVTDEQRQALPKNILAYTRTNNISELQKLYAVADYFINPTYEDNFPTTNIEALACGTPVITYRTGGSSEAMDLDSGRIVKVGDTRQLLAATTGYYAENACVKRSKYFTQTLAKTAYTKLYYKE